MKVYHGSYTTIDTIDLSKAAPRKDFGKGFYVTKFRDHAETWANIIGDKYDTKGCVTEFEYTETDFTKSVCKIKHFDGYSKEWLDFVVMNRKKRNSEPAHEYDIVEGPVADDKVQHKIRAYLRGKISREAFLEELKWHEQTHQICFCTSRSLQMIDKVDGGGEMEWNISDIGEPLLERLMLDTEMDEVQATDAFYTSETFARLADESTGLHLRPWEEIYDLLCAELKI